jgi:uncharacterized protein
VSARKHPPPDFEEELRQATLKVYERYAVEVVEGFDFCPWARGARTQGQVALFVVFSADRDDFASSLDALRELHEQRPETDIALVIYPLLDLDRLEFEDYVRRFRALAESGPPQLDAFAMAAFHPLAGADTSHPDKLVPFVRRAPDPTLQLVRKSALSAIKGLQQGTLFVDVSTLTAESFRALQAPPAKALRERIAEQNLATVREAGVTAIEAVLTDIAREREALHADLARRFGQRGPRRPDPG